MKEILASHSNVGDLIDANPGIPPKLLVDATNDPFFGPLVQAFMFYESEFKPDHGKRHIKDVSKIFVNKNYWVCRIVAFKRIDGEISTKVHRFKAKILSRPYKNNRHEFVIDCKGNFLGNKFTEILLEEYGLIQKINGRWATWNWIENYGRLPKH